MKVFALVIAFFLFTGCSHLQRIDRNEFEKYMDIHQPKLVSTNLIGYTNQNVYIEKLTKRALSQGWNISVLWIPIDELSKEQFEKVKALAESQLKNK
jgi:hypothetical protein